MNFVVKPWHPPNEGVGMAFNREGDTGGVGTMELNVVPAIDGVYRVVVDGSPTGYVVETGGVFVSLRGAVYNTSVEVGQSAQFEAAVRMLAREVVTTG